MYHALFTEGHCLAGRLAMLCYRKRSVQSFGLQVGRELEGLRSAGGRLSCQAVSAGVDGGSREHKGPQRAYLPPLSSTRYEEQNEAESSGDHQACVGRALFQK